ncbi:MAG: hypothetical protein LBC98_02230 [Prevotellaceae bacterium]|nr:hypothetical protein [Prevotellaceae bacterium]
MATRIQSNCQSKSEPRSIFSVWKPRLAFAGGIAAVILLSISFFSYFGADNKASSLDAAIRNAVYVSDGYGLQVSYPYNSRSRGFSYVFAGNKKIDEDIMIKHLALRNVNLNDIVSARY